MGVTKKYVKKAREADVVEAKVQEAIMGINSGLYSSHRDAAKQLRMPSKSNTIWRRSTGRSQDRRFAHAGQQLLTLVQETIVGDWMVWYGQTGEPLSKELLAAIVYELVGVWPSDKWIRSFTGRNTRIILGRGTGIDPIRAQAFNKPVVTHHLNLLQSTFDEATISQPVKHLFPARNLYNMDEIGIQPCGTRKGSKELFFYGQADRLQYRLQSDDLELVTILECTAADGTAPILPCLVFGGKLFCPEWFLKEFPGLLYATTENGWTSEKVYHAWFEKCFVPHSKAHSDPRFPVVLMFDGHGSHSTLEVIDLAQKNNIILYKLPPHTTHRLQPCDVGTFGPLKSLWHRKVHEFRAKEGRFLSIRDVPKVYMETRQEAFKPDTIKKAFHKSGIDVSSGFPRVDHNVFSNSDFATSIGSSTLLDLPHSALSLINGPYGGKDHGKQREVVAAEDPEEVVEAVVEEEEEEERACLPGPLCASDTEDEDFVPGDDDTDDDDEYHNDHPLFSSTFHRDIQSMSTAELRDMLIDAKDLVDNLQERIQITQTQAVFLGNYAKKVKGQMNAKKRRKSGNNRVVSIHASIATSAEGRAAAEAQARERVARQEKAQEKQNQKEAQAMSVRNLRCEVGQGNMVFDQTLSKLKVADLCNLCWNLGEPETGTKDVMLGCIQNYFDLHPDLRSDPHYIALFPRSTASSEVAPGTSTFDQPLSRLNVADLRTLCRHLDSDMDCSGTKQVLIQHIKDHFENNQQLYSDSRYAALFPLKRKRVTAVDDVEIESPSPLQRPRLFPPQPMASSSRVTLSDITSSFVNH